MSTERPTFYDEHPFDWASPDAGTDIRSVVSPVLVDLIESLDSRSLVLDIGCGPGRVLGFLVKRGIPCVGVDRSSVSLALAVNRYRCSGAVGDNLRLPLADGIADVLVSDGVIHHTDDPRSAFAENLRILKPGGRMYLGVYKSSGRYPLLYKFPGGLIRRSLEHGWSRPLVVIFARVPYFVLHFIRSKGKRTWAGARNLFYDYFVTPRVGFLGREVIEQWCATSGARILRYGENPGSNVHSFLLQKPISGTKDHTGSR
ncbi:MAG TPA: class I SAM-dependent methyltransferase [Candidatus Acidoferrales bacterium]